MEGSAQLNVQPMPHALRINFSAKKGYTTSDIWANWAGNAKLRPTSSTFVLMKLRECVAVLVVVGLLPKPQTTQWTFNQAAARKENTCETRLAPLQVPTAPSKSWWIYISPWALHLLVIQLIFRPPAPAHWLTHLCESSWAGCLSFEHQPLSGEGELWKQDKLN